MDAFILVYTAKCNYETEKSKNFKCLKLGSIDFTVQSEIELDSRTDLQVNYIKPDKFFIMIQTCGYVNINSIFKCPRLAKIIRAINPNYIFFAVKQDQHKINYFPNQNGEQNVGLGKSFPLMTYKSIFQSIIYLVLYA